MKIDLFAKDIQLTDPIKVFINDKIGSLSKLFNNNESVSAKVEIARTTRHHKTGEVYYAEANLLIKGALIRAQANHRDVRSAITEVKDELKIKIKKFKEKKKDLSRKSKR